jgi:hypothetical protein
VATFWLLAEKIFLRGLRDLERELFVALDSLIDGSPFEEIISFCFLETPFCLSGRLDLLESSECDDKSDISPE